MNPGIETLITHAAHALSCGVSEAEVANRLQYEWAVSCDVAYLSVRAGAVLLRHRRRRKRQVKWL